MNKAPFRMCRVGELFSSQARGGTLSDQRHSHCQERCRPRRGPAETCTTTGVGGDGGRVGVGGGQGEVASTRRSRSKSIRNSRRLPSATTSEPRRVVVVMLTGGMGRGRERVRRQSIVSGTV